MGVNCRCELQWLEEREGARKGWNGGSFCPSAYRSSSLLYTDRDAVNSKNTKQWWPGYNWEPKSVSKNVCSFRVDEFVYSPISGNVCTGHLALSSFFELWRWSDFRVLTCSFQYEFRVRLSGMTFKSDKGSLNFSLFLFACFDFLWVMLRFVRPYVR
jgi:hypothetical protein